MPPAAPLLLSRDPELVDAVLRLAEVAGVVPDVVSSSADARRWWTSAPVVLIGAELVAAATAAGLADRPDIVVVSLTEPDDDLWRAALALGARGVTALPQGDAALVQRLLAAPAPSRDRARVVGVVGGSGGAGASLTAVALALAGVRRGLSVALVDSDPRGGGLDLALCAEELPGARWPDLRGVTGVLPADTLTRALTVVHGLHLLSTARDDHDALPASALPAVLDSLVLAVELVVLDLARGGPDPVLVKACDVVLLVATPDVRGTAAARSVARGLRDDCDLRLVVRPVRGAGIEADELGTWLELPLAAELPYAANLAADVDSGEPPGLSSRSRLARVASQLLADLVAP